MNKKISNLARQRQYQDKYKRDFSYQWFRYCKDPLENIDGWSEMLNDTSGQSWVIHHRDEISEDGEVVSRDELKNRGKYYHIAAKKLVFLTEFEHMSLHHTGKTLSEESKNKMSKPKSEDHKKKLQENSWMRGRTGSLHPRYDTNKYDITEEDLYELYVVQGLTQLEIAEKFGCGAPRICWYLKKFGIRK